MPSIQAPEYTQAFAANGDTTGIIQVSDSSGFYVGALAYLVRSDAGARCIIVNVPDATHVGVRIVADDNEQQAPVQRYGGHSDLTGWTTAKSSTITQPQQLARVEPQFLKPNKANV